jgi:beta-galactosidase
MKSLSLLLLAAMWSLVMNPELFAADSPRQRLTMDREWKFVLGDQVGAQSVDFNDGDWTRVDLPHDWSIAGPFDQMAPARGGGGYLPTGIGWYRKTFRLPDSLRDKRIAIEFDGIYENAEVWINNHSLGKRPFGYISFVYDLTANLNFDGDNVIAVRVDNSKQPNSRWYSGSGIYRHTWLLVTNGLHIPPWGTYVTTPQATNDSATVQIKIQVVNSLPNTAHFDLLTTLLDRDGRKVQQTQSEGQLDANGQTELTQQLKLDKPNLWSIQNPYLYTVRCALKIGDSIVDQYDTPIGIRSIRFDLDRGFLLNGNHVKLNGVCVHGDGGSVGTAVPEGVWARRLKLLKEMGCNAIRTSHNPPAPEFLDLCDQMGFLVMDEAFDEWRGGKTAQGYHVYFDEWSQRDLTDFIHRDRNHPCVVLWSAGNEIGEQITADGAEVLKKLVDTFHREDPTRLVTAACDKVYAEPKSATPEFLALLDVVGYNYVDRWRDYTNKYYSIDRQAFPQRLFIGTESVSMSGTRGDYRSLFGPLPIPVPATEAATEPATEPAAGPTTRPFGGFGFRPLPESNRRIDIEQLWKFVGNYDYVAGDFMWTGIDYLGEARWPNKAAPFGVLDTCGFKKDGYYFYQSQWTSTPVLHLFPHWNWPGKLGDVIPVICYTNCDTVELFLNGKSFGLKGYEFPRRGMETRYGYSPPRERLSRTTADLHLEWDVPYEPGTLRAVGVINGQTVTEEIETTGNPAAISLSLDKSNLIADARDVAHLTVQIVDDQGRTVPTADNDVTFDLQGEGQIIGVDNGDPASHESFKADHRKAFNGLCLAILRSTQNPGSIRITPRSHGLREAMVELNSIASR